MADLGWKNDLAHEPTMASAPPAISASVILSEDDIKQIAARFEIDTKYASELRKLTYYEGTLILDDSGSMIAPTSSSQTRWGEAHRMLEIISELLRQLTGHDPRVRLLNRPEHWTASQLLAAWPTLKPAGPTPIRACLESLTIQNEVPSLITLITDGEPTQVIQKNGQWENVEDSGFYSFVESFQKRNQKNHINVILCTSNDSTVRYWKRIDEIPRIDVIDDYETEQKERKGGMTFGTYVAKALLGSIVPRLDDDESQGCCAIL